MTLSCEMECLMVRARSSMFSLFILLVVMAAPGFAQPGPTVDQLLELKRAGSPAIAPDGRRVAYTVRQPDWEADVYRTAIWVVDVATGTPRRLTASGNSSSAPVWSSDSRRLAFLSDQSGRLQIHVLNPDGGPAAPITTGGDGIDGVFAWSPDGSQIAYTATESKAEPWQARDKKYGEFEIVGEDHRRMRLWVVNLSSRRTRQLTPGQISVGTFQWSPDGAAIAFDHAVSKEPAEPADISIVSLADGRVRSLVTQEGPDRAPHWSPDGTRIAFESGMGPNSRFYSNRHIAAIPSAGGAVEDLSPTFDERPTLIAWKKDGVYFSAMWRMWSALYRLDPASGAFSKLAPGDDWSVANVTLSADASAAAFLGTGLRQFTEVFVAPIATMQVKKLTDLSAQVAGWPQPTQEVVAWKSRDGTPMDGLLYKPANFEPGKRYPLLVVVHGGLPGSVRLGHFTGYPMYPIEVWLNRGALVFQPNYRGSAGYGEKFRLLTLRNLGIGDAWDVLSGIDSLVAQGLVDNDRIGTMGWSQGGYISAFLATHDSARFKAASVGAGISDWLTYYIGTDVPPFTRHYLGATPWDDPKVYADTSPITYIKNARTPTLIQHGELDKRVPLPNAYELYRGLLDQNVPVKLVVYKGFGHALTKPKAQRAAMEHNLEWFGKYIWGEK